MRTRWIAGLGIGCLALCVGAAMGHVTWSKHLEAPTPYAIEGYHFAMDLNLPGTRFEIFDAFTGNVKPWWDHTFSKDPAELVIEPQVGGSFRELYDDKGNGCEHARVTHVHRGQMLRMIGPLGLVGQGVELEMLFRFEPDGENTRLHLDVHAYGKLNPQLAGVIQSVWNHFLVERFEPYIRAGKHRK